MHLFCCHRRRWFAPFALLLAPLACRGNSFTDLPSIAGQYTVVRVDGQVPPCCAKPDPSGTYATTDSVDAAELDLHGDNTYTWGITPNYRYADGSGVGGTPFVFSSGTYTVDGQRLILNDPGGLGTTVGSVNGNLISVPTRDHQFVFAKLIQLPPG